MKNKRYWASWTILLICVFTNIVLLSMTLGKKEKQIVERVEIKTVEVEKKVNVIKYVVREVPTHEFITYLNPRVDPSMAKQIGVAVDTNSKKHGLPKLLVLAIIYKESSFNPLANSKVAYGLMQIYPKYHQEKLEERGIKDKRMLYHIDVNVDIGCQIFKQYYEASKGDLSETFHKYLSKKATKAQRDRYEKRILTAWAKMEFYKNERK